jgi:hypothetical protein
MLIVCGYFADSESRSGSHIDETESKNPHILKDTR